MPRTILEKVVGNLQVENEEVHVQGMVAGDVQVWANGVLLLDGMVTGNLLVQPSGTAVIRGTVRGNVTNGGGALEIFGVVNGHLHEVSGNTVVHDGAVVGG